MSKAKVTIEFKGIIEINAQEWSDDCKLSQIKQQAKDEVKHWTIMVKKGSKDPVPVNYIKAEVTEVILAI